MDNKMYKSAKAAMQDRAYLAVYRGEGAIPEEEIVAAMTVRGNLAAAWRVLGELEESGQFLRNPAGFLDL